MLAAGPRRSRGTQANLGAWDAQTLGQAHGLVHHPSVARAAAGALAWPPAMVLEALISVPSNLGYLALFALVGMESSGIPVPGETALVAGGVTASQHKLSIVAVIVVAAVAAIVGDNVGYLIGRRLGRRLLTRPGRTLDRRLAALERGQELFNRHGPKAVFFGRWVAGLRIWASWLAGMTRMPWRQFLLFNALGGISWAMCFGLLSYFAGHAAARLIERVGLGAAAVVIVVVVAAAAVVHRRRSRRAPTDGCTPPAAVGGGQVPVPPAGPRPGAGSTPPSAGSAPRRG